MKEKKGIRRRILLTTTAINLMLAVVLVAVMVYFMKSLTNTLLVSTLQPMAKTASQSVENSLHVMIDRILIVAENVVTPDADAQQNQKTLDKIKSGIEFVWLGLYTPDGALYTGSGGSPAVIADKRLYTTIKRTQNPVIDDTSLGSSGPEVTIGVPVLGGEGELKYYLIGSYKYDVLKDVLGSINISEHGTAFIINDEGYYMAHRDMSNVTGHKKLTDSFAAGDDIDKLLKRMKGGETGVSISDTSAAGQRYFAFSPVRGTRWSLAVTAPADDFAEASNYAIFVSVIITVVLLLLSSLLTLQLARKIQGPLGRATRRIAAVASGDLHTSVNVERTGDEIETLSQALDNTVTSMNAYTSELSRVLSELSNSNLDVYVDGEFHGDFVEMKDSLNHIVDFLNQIMFSIQQASVKVAATSHMVIESASDVQRNSTGQSGSLTELHREAQNIASNIDEVDDRTAQVGQLAKNAIAALEKGEARMRNMLSAMDAISRNSEEITQINKALEDISVKTNILALNASVEAAHAGAAGYGFAVVAEEVRSLAAKSTASSKKTSEVIRNSLQNIKQGSAYAEQTAASMREIMDVSGKIDRISGELSEAVGVQKTSLGAITRRIDEINALAGSNLDTGRRSVEASRSLVDEADVLKSMAERFRLKSEGMR